MENAKVTLQDTIENLLKNKRYATLRDILTTMNPVDIAAIFEELQNEKMPVLYRLLPKDIAADVFVEMEEDTQQFLIHSLSDTELKEVLDDMFLDDVVDMIEEMPANVVKRILRQSTPEDRKQINALLKFPEDSAGSIMTTELVILRPDMTAEEAIKRIRRTGVDKETIYTCYVADNLSKLRGIVTIKDLLLAEDDTKVSDMMDTNVISVNTYTDQEEVAAIIKKYDFLALPVVDTENRLVGIVTIDDAVDVMQEEATEDIQKMAAITPNTDKPYLKIGIFSTWLSRIPWLLLLMISATFTGMIISSFEDALAASVALAAFIPMLMDTGGNTGSQASVTVIRALSLKEIQFKDLIRVLWKEIRVAVLCGISLAAAAFAKILLVDMLLLGNADVTTMVAFVVCLTLAITVVVAKIIGCCLPMFAYKLGFDPAVMASPFITTIVDAVSLIVYFFIATNILQL
ncbi:MAG: magnesium transporter [Oscillospiraceae bacterium]|nr:magnesium transporter [Oscillospiraceae bacterium]